MAFDPLESSLESSEPIELYKFTLGSEEFLYSNTEDTITILGDIYVPTTIKRGDLAIGRDERNKVVTVEVPANNTLAQRYVGTPPGQRASLSIFRVQRQDGALETALIYKGSVLTVQFPQDQDVGVISLQSIEAASSREIPRFTYMGMCNHILYDSGCKVDSSLFRHVGTASAVLNDTVTVSGAGSSGFDFTGGYAKPTAFTDFRLIIAQSGDVLTLLLPFEQDPLNTNIEVYAGCNHLLTGDCSQVFANEIEFGGFPFVPTKNVWSSGL